MTVGAPAAVAVSPGAAVFRVAVVSQVVEAQVEAGNISRSNTPSSFFTAEEQKTIVDCVSKTEAATMAEIRVRVEKRCEGEPLERCRSLLEELGMTHTQGRTGVLIYLSLEDRKVAVYGDAAVHSVIGDDGWKKACAQLQDRFKQGDFVAAICEAIYSLAPILSERFPPNAENPNELPDEPSYEE